MTRIEYSFISVTFINPLFPQIFLTHLVFVQFSFLLIYVFLLLPVLTMMHLRIMLYTYWTPLLPKRRLKPTISAYGSGRPNLIDSNGKTRSIAELVLHLSLSHQFYTLFHCLLLFTPCLSASFF